MKCLMVLFLSQAIIHPDTGEKILMPFRMSGTVSACGCGVWGLVMFFWSFAPGTVTAPRGSAGRRGKVRPSWALIKISLPRWRRRSWDLEYFSPGLLRFFSRVIKQHDVKEENNYLYINFTNVRKYEHAPKSHLTVSNSLSFHRFYSIRHTCGRIFFYMFIILKPHFHPQLKQICSVFFFFSLSCCCFVKVVGLLLPNQTLASTIFWQVNPHIRHLYRQIMMQLFLQVSLTVNAKVNDGLNHFQS